MQKFSEEQARELRLLMRRSSNPGERIKAVALWNLATGKTRREVAEFLGVSKTSVTEWTQRFLVEGASGLAIKSGRGRRPRAMATEVEQYLRQSPRAFGLSQTRWTLRALAQVVPSLKGFTDMGVWKVLQRTGYRYKRGQPSVHSPDPEYGEKKGLWNRRSARPSRSKVR